MIDSPTRPEIDVPASFTGVIALWPKPKFDTLAADIGESVAKVGMWSSRDSIPAEYWQVIMRAAKRRGFHVVDADLLVRLAAERRAA